MWRIHIFASSKERLLVDRIGRKIQISGPKSDKKKRHRVRIRVWNMVLS